jgi:hypothetical protein
VAAWFPAASFAQPIVLAHIGPFTGPTASDAQATLVIGSPPSMAAMAAALRKAGMRSHN